MDLLVLGGTRFVGRAVVAEARSRGWDVTVFNRGSIPPPDGVTQLTGDRTAPSGLDGLRDRRWDLVVDTWASAPSAVRHAARLLAGRADRYAYVSSRSVYEFPTPRGATEDAPLVDAHPDAPEVAYPQDKRGAEMAVVEAFGEDRSLLARAGLVLGPWEDVGRLPWWLQRTDRPGEVLAPGPEDAPLQHVDARDLAAFVLDASVEGRGGAFDVVSQPGHATMGRLLRACVDTTGAGAELVWVEPQTILDAEVEPWTDLPIWLPPGTFSDAMHGSDPTKAHEAGLQVRPIEETVRDTWAWMRALDGRIPQRADLDPVGLEPTVERRLLAAARR